MRKAKFLHLDSRSTGPFVQASRLRIAMCNPAISEVRGSNTCELPWARMFVGPESFPNARDQTQNLSLYIYDIYIYAFVHVDVVKKSFHNMSQPFFSTIFGDSEGRTPQPKPAIFPMAPRGRFRRKVFAARAKDANGREEVDVVVIGAKICWLDAES